jgi:hypothetical protein
MSFERITRRRFLQTGTVALAVGRSESVENGFAPLFDGASLAGWEGDPNLWLVEDGMLIGRSPGIGYNDFLATEEPYGDFILRLQIQLVGNVGNGGIQFRSERVDGDTEMIGYQADVGPDYWGSLYDESRRRVTLAQPDEETLQRALKPNDWNDYEIRAEGQHITLKLNGVTTVDYVETDPSIPLTGHIAVQIHSGPPMETRYRNIRIQDLRANR